MLGLLGVMMMRFGKNVQAVALVLKSVGSFFKKAIML